MAISKYTQDNEKKKFVESTVTASQPGVAVVNPDGSNIGGGTGASASQVQGNVASGATDSGNPVKTGGVYNSTLPTFTNGQRGDFQVGTRGSLHAELWTSDSNTALTTAATNTDAQATGSSASRLEIIARNSTYNGTTFDRARSATTGTNTSGTGVQAVGLLAQFDDTAPTTITENNFGNVRMTANRALMVEQAFTYGRATADTQIKATAGFVHSVTIAPLTATPTAGLVTVYDSAAESGTVIYSEWVAATTPGHTVTLNVNAATGIYVGFDGALANVQVTVSYR